MPIRVYEQAQLYTSLYSRRRLRRWFGDRQLVQDLRERAQNGHIVHYFIFWGRRCQMSMREGAHLTSSISSVTRLGFELNRWPKLECL